MGTEVWFRNPHNYIRELAEVGAGRIVWERGLIAKRRIDPIKHAGTYFAGRPWRLMMMGEQGTAEYTSESPDTPVGVYPTWDAAEESFPLLEEMMQYPIGDDADLCNDQSIPLDQRPVANQVHRVVVINIPSLSSAQGRAYVRQLKELQEDYPECLLHVHGLYSWRVSFGMGFGATDVDPRTNAGKGKVTLPSGKEMIAEKTVAVPQWVTMLGMKPIDLTREPRNRCIYNIKSALWASDNFMENVAFAARREQSQATRHIPDTTSNKAPRPLEVKNKSPFTGPVSPQPSDKINCDTCSLQTSCKFYRQGSVCSVPGSEPAELANHFKTRDAQTVMDGLSTILQLQARRLDKGVAEENVYGELDPEVSKLANSLFANGVKFAKLLDPTLNGGPSVQVNVGNVGATQAAMQAATPNQMLGSIVRELESRGVKRENITEDMILNLISEMGGEGGRDGAVQGHVLAAKDVPQ